MMPETGSDKSVRLYKPNNDFTQWTLYKSILSNKKYVDSSIIFKDNIYFLFTTLCEDNKYKLMLFCSEKIDGKYELHPKSPIAIGNNNGRCGGSVFEYEGKLYSPTQICENYYAEGLKINEILFLTKNNYSEKYLKTIIPNNDEFYSLGGHHFSFVFFKEEIIIATDGLSLSLNFWEVGRRVHRKLKGLV
jgi:beta-xylosidase